MSKAARIRELYAQGLRHTAISEIVGCSIAYVEAVRQRGKKGSPRPCDIAWVKANPERRKIHQHTTYLRRKQQQAEAQ